ncbi:hypothetical protein H6P81_005149 [Aristolochia fimbriata]|uniref:Uncharacterized protein n=1 Tax=Aristolochia fimbriata TaxID=158543 RepID=A0AAV7EVV8_ARIFI|nr:hypothetical protein H6P81_005149 [Aristolochia fimbriata]
MAAYSMFRSGAELKIAGSSTSTCTVFLKSVSVLGFSFQNRNPGSEESERVSILGLISSFQNRNPQGKDAFKDEKESCLGMSVRKSRGVFIDGWSFSGSLNYHHAGTCSLWASKPLKMEIKLISRSSNIGNGCQMPPARVVSESALRAATCLFKESGSVALDNGRLKTGKCCGGDNVAYRHVHLHSGLGGYVKDTLATGTFTPGSALRRLTAKESCCSSCGEEKLKKKAMV